VEKIWGGGREEKGGNEDGTRGNTIQDRRASSRTDGLGNYS